MSLHGYVKKYGPACGGYKSPAQREQERRIEAAEGLITTEVMFGSQIRALKSKLLPFLKRQKKATNFSRRHTANEKRGGEARQLRPVSTAPRRPRARLRAFSKRRQRTSKAYRDSAREFVRFEAAVKTCPVVAAVKELREGFAYGHPISSRISEVHHMRGRLGPLLTDQRFWLGVSKLGHRWVHEHPKQARELGFLCQPGEWNTQPKDGR